ncbi:hypothetical protein PENTCL1PPCAC_6229, partial [Pristionchus entomophagus]
MISSWEISSFLPSSIHPHSTSLCRRVFGHIDVWRRRFTSSLLLWCGGHGRGSFLLAGGRPHLDRFIIFLSRTGHGEGKRTEW